MEMLFSERLEIHSEKVNMILESELTPTVSEVGETASTEGPVLSSGPPLGDI